MARIVFQRNAGFLLLGLWLILMGLFDILHVSFSGQAISMDALAIAAGICILIGR